MGVDRGAREDSLRRLAVDVIDFEYGDGPENNRYWHTAEDTLDKISAQSLKTVGDVVLLSLPKIESQVK